MIRESGFIPGKRQLILPRILIMLLLLRKGIFSCGHPVMIQEIRHLFPAVLQSNSIVLCYSDAVWIDKNGKNIGFEKSDIDTVGMSKIERIKKVFWNLGYAYPIYGVFRKETLNAVLPYQKILGPDVVLLSELSAIGEFARLHEPLFNIRKLSDYGDWHIYFQKSMNINLNRKKAIGLFFQFIVKNYRAVIKHAQSPGEKLIIKKIFLVDSFIKYHWMLSGLIRLR
jgi:hypothetical protein